jgi:hypothetical protein
MPFLIALFVAVEEVERQRRRTAAAPAELGTDVNDVPRDSDADTAKPAPLHANSAKRSEETDDQLSPSRGASHDE